MNHSITKLSDIDICFNDNEGSNESNESCNFVIPLQHEYIRGVAVCSNMFCEKMEIWINISENKNDDANKLTAIVDYEKFKDYYFNGYYYGPYSLETEYFGKLCGITKINDRYIYFGHQIIFISNKPIIFHSLSFGNYYENSVFCKITKIDNTQNYDIDIIWKKGKELFGINIPILDYDIFYNASVVWLQQFIENIKIEYNIEKLTNLLDPIIEN